MPSFLGPLQEAGALAYPPRAASGRDGVREAGLDRHGEELRTDRHREQVGEAESER
jgi:hypothetical protein